MKYRHWLRIMALPFYWSLHGILSLQLELICLYVRPPVLLRAKCSKKQGIDEWVINYAWTLLSLITNKNFVFFVADVTLYLAKAFIPDEKYWYKYLKSFVPRDSHTMKQFKNCRYSNQLFSRTSKLSHIQKW